ncbi:putative fatty acid desaturase [Nocardioides baekrokdamisoli]|uniref:Putative fatty acid desaturase n=1 Tax=Nocardioides baekrokdamisoli TaxID=1804624 RepID=A0A3G9IBX9_9ACTN|nr:acyl-CoA desaturase [Nocardioides baekrokdamisoli]BBH16387.1 putative fatty acid desaturase [Nocardioides baekrokdamisoli]
MTTTVMNKIALKNPFKFREDEAVPTLTPEQMDAFGVELDAIRARVIADLGEVDREYLYKIVRIQRRCEIAGRALFYLPVIGWLPAVAALSVSKILDNMEIGHNVMHGQYDWLGDPDYNSRVFDWDTMAPAENWKYGHNYMHHTYTNIVGKDRDVGYGILRMAEDQPWRPYYLGNAAYAFGLMMLFEWGVGVHDLEVDELVAGRRTWAENRDIGARIWKKVKKQVTKDYIMWPLLTGPLFPLTFAGNFTANIVRNIWTFNIIFCGHFPAGAQTFTIEECENETRGHWYYRQLLGSANISGSKLMHVMSGNLSHQIEHHLFPDLPARRYPEIAAEIREICERYDLPYNSGPLHRQLGSVFAKIVRLSFPTPRRKVTAVTEVTAAPMAA